MTCTREPTLSTTDIERYLRGSIDTTEEDDWPSVSWEHALRRQRHATNPNHGEAGRSHTVKRLERAGWRHQQLSRLCRGKYSVKVDREWGTVVGAQIERISGR